PLHARTQHSIPVGNRLKDGLTSNSRSPARQGFKPRRLKGHVPSFRQPFELKCSDDPFTRHHLAIDAAESKLIALWVLMHVPVRPALCRLAPLDGHFEPAWT